MAHRVLIAGCGDLGTAVAELLHAAGHYVCGLRRNIPSEPLIYEAIQADVTHLPSLHSLASSTPDILIYCVAATEQTDANYQSQYVQGLSNVLQSVATVKSLKHVFFVSSTRGYGQQTNELLDESVQPQPADFGGQRLLEAERLLKEHALPSTALRLSGIYGPGRTRMIKLAQSPESWPQTNTWTNRIHRDDAASFIAFLVEKALAREVLNDCYIVTDSKPVGQHEVLAWLAAELGVQGEGAEQPVSGGRRLSNQRMLDTGFKLKYPDYRSGYTALLA